jgi:hypothetical protein
MRGPLAFLIFAVAAIVMVTGAGPQENLMMPPAATADTTALEVQLRAVPLPITRVGWEVSTARAAAGTAAWPFGLPCRNGFGLAFLTAALGVGVAEGETATWLRDGPAAASGWWCGPQAVSTESDNSPTTSRASRLSRIRRY